MTELVHVLYSPTHDGYYAIMNNGVGGVNAIEWISWVEHGVMSISLHTEQNPSEKVTYNGISQTIMEHMAALDEDLAKAIHGSYWVPVKRKWVNGLLKYKIPDHTKALRSTAFG